MIQAVCTVRRDCTEGCIEKVGAIDATVESPKSLPRKPKHLWPVETLRPLLNKGSVICFTYADNEIAYVEAFDCKTCGNDALRTVRTKPDATKANNLDSLPICFA